MNWKPEQLDESKVTTEGIKTAYEHAEYKMQKTKV